MSQTNNQFSSQALERDLCKKLEAVRLLKNISQEKLAQAAGVSRRTISRMENGQGVSLDTFIRVMLALNLKEHLLALLPSPDIRPIERAAKKRERRHASSPRTTKQPKEWEWGSDQ